MSYDTKENFKGFLIGKRLHNRFMALLELNHGCSLDEFLDNYSPNGYIDKLCAWSRTKEKHAFWSAVNKEWRMAYYKGVSFPAASCKSIW